MIRPNSTVNLFAEECERRGYPVTWFTTQSMMATIRGRREMFQWTRCSLNSTGATRIANNKNTAAKILSEKGISVPEGKFFKNREKKSAVEYGQSIFPCVVKPVKSHGHGNGCTVGVRNRSELDNAFDYAASKDRAGVLVQREFVGDEARFMIIEGKVVSVLQKLPGTNGYVGGRETGIIYRQIIDSVHPSYIRLMERAVSFFPGLGVCGPDVKAKDFTKPASKKNHMLVEINTGMGIYGHLYPDHGKPINVASMMIDAIENRIDREIR